VGAAEEAETIEGSQNKKNRTVPFIVKLQEVFNHSQEAKANLQ